MRIFRIITQSDWQKQIQVEMGKDLSIIERLTRSTILLFIVCHFLACFYVKLSQDNPNDNWWLTQLASNTSMPDSKPTMYITAWYWAIQTVTTVGQGDIASKSMDERVQKIVAMIIGVIVFSEYISAFTTDRDDDNLIDPKLNKVKNNTEFLRKK